MDEPIFRREWTTDWWTLDARAPSAPGARIALLKPAGISADDVLPASRAWRVDGGVFVFAARAPEDAEAAVARVRALLRSPAYAGTRLLWMEDPASGPGGPRLSGVPRGDGAWWMTEGDAFEFGGYTLRIGGSATIEGPSAANGWQVTVTPPGEASNVSFSSPAAQWIARNTPLSIPFAGPRMGCLVADFDFPGGRADVDRLGAGCTFYVPDPDEPEAGDPLPVRFPVLLPEGAWAARGSFDPFRPLDGARTALTLAAPAEGFPSGLTTARGRGVRLVPLAGTGGEPDAGLAFARRPWRAGPSAPMDPDRFALMPQGAFTLAVGDGGGHPIHRVLCGATGTEYAGLAAGAEYHVHFAPGAAFAAGAVEGGAAEGGALRDWGTTAWAYLTPAAPDATVTYYAQPDRAPLFRAAEGDAPLDFLEMPAAALPAGFDPADGARRFPLAPFRGIDPAALPLARALEADVLAPVRRARIAALVAHEAPAPAPVHRVRALADMTDPAERSAAANSGYTQGLTPQGIAIEMDPSGGWRRLSLARTTPELPAAPGDPEDPALLQLTEVSGPLRSALQGPQPFLVIADPAALQASASVRYRLTQASLAALAALPAAERGPDAALETVRAWVRQQGFPVWRTRADYEAALLGQAEALAPFLEPWRRQGELFELAAGGWVFRTAPGAWPAPPGQARGGTILVMKLRPGRLDALVDDTAAWSWPDGGRTNGSLDATRDRLRAAIAAAKEAVAGAAGGASPYAGFVRRATDPAWTGVLFFDVSVPPATLAGPLQGIVAGVDPARFSAHHVGWDLTPASIVQGRVELRSTGLFAVVDYRDPDPPVVREGLDFDFKVLALTVEIRNSAVALFTLRTALLVASLFGATATLNGGPSGNNVILTGVYQRQGNAGTYTFRQEGTATFRLARSALRSVEVTSATLSTVLSAEPGEDASLSRFVFTLGGRLRFADLSPFDAFSFGPFSLGPTEPETDGWLRFEGLRIGMSFSPRTPTQRRFTFDPSRVTLQAPADGARPRSLFARFPMTVAGLVSSPNTAPVGQDPRGATPADLGYVAVGAPVDQTLPGFPWYGLAFDLDLGRLGALGASAGVHVTFLAAWSADRAPVRPEGMPDEDAGPPRVWFGLRFPGSGGAGSTLPLQGVLTLGFRAIRFSVSEKADRRDYLLRLRGFALRLLGLSFPPGNADVVLFAPAEGARGKLGWYAAYAQGGDALTPGGG
ncbi:MAG TPA: hypothetical protein VHG93_25530 [Longimicrobium sp.]|nr:hypothetical protein [Longimicrobium sp.]